MSSSNRAAVPCDAVVTDAGQPTGPVRLPDQDPDLFIEQFNRTYHTLGISIEPRSRAGRNDDRES